jgi:outer membrane protein assembly factor BamB
MVSTLLNRIHGIRHGHGLRLAVTTLALACIAGVSMADDWPCYRGTNKNGITSEQIAKWPPTEVWRANVGQGYSQVVVSQGKVYTMGWSNNQDYVRCFSESSTGTNPTPLWTQSYSCGSVDHQGTRATPTVDGNEVYTFSHEGRLGCYDRTNGTPLWSTNTTLGRPASWNFASSPLIEGNLVIVNAGGHGVAFDKTTHAVAWGTNDAGGAGYSSPFAFTRGADRTVVVFGGSKCSGVDPATGNVRWYFTWAEAMSDPIIWNDKVWMSCGYGKGCALANLGSNQLSEVWHNTALANKENCSVLYNNYLYGINEAQCGGGLRCVRISDGAVMWNSASSGVNFGTESALMLAGTNLVVMNGTDGGGLAGNDDLVIVQANTNAYTELHRMNDFLTGDTFTCPVLANGKLYIRSQTGVLICYDVSASAPGGPTGTVQFSSAAYSVAENGGSATILVTRTNGSSGAISVNYATANGTATAGLDYTAATGTLNFADGETSKTFTLTILNDSIREPDETVNLTLSGPTGGATLGSPINAVLTITDDERSLVVFSSHGGAVPPVGTNVLSPVLSSLDMRIGQSSDDARETVSNGVGKINSGSLDLVDHPDNGNQIEGFRFTNLTISAGAVITAAYIQFTSYATNTNNTAAYTIQAEASNNASTFNAAIVSNIAARTRTSAHVSWSPPNWTGADLAGADQRTPDLSSVVQELVNRGGWSSGNAIAFLFSGSGWRIVNTYDGSPAKAALLHVEWATGGVTCAVTNSPVINGTTQYVCRGWAGIGSVPASGTTTNTGPFVLTTDSTITWLWDTNTSLQSCIPPAAWIEQYYPGTNNYTNAAASDTDHDGMTAWQEYLAGTDPTNRSSSLKVGIVLSNGVILVSCPAKAAGGGAGYGGMSRFYTLQTATNILAGGWQGVTGLTNILVGSDSTIAYTNSVPPVVQFYRTKARLQ